MKCCFCLVFAASALPGLGIERLKFDHSNLDGLLQAYVHADGLVEYSGFETDPRFDAYLKQIAVADLSEFGPEEKLAFYINAYNALVIRNVLDHMPIDSPLSVKGFFKRKRFQVAGDWLTLDQIEYERIFELDSIWVHFGLVCAARSCPRLQPRAYEPSTVVQQLRSNAREFFRDRTKNRLDRKRNILYLSKILDWFRESFDAEFGSLKSFALRFLTESDRSYATSQSIKIEFLEYDWTLNAWPP